MQPLVASVILAAASERHAVLATGLSQCDQFGGPGGRLHAGKPCQLLASDVHASIVELVKEVL